MEAWTQFFVRAGIPKEIAQKYAKSFHNNRITKEMLTELDKSTLSELGVTAIGDQLCILRRIKAAKSAIERGNEEVEDPEPPKAAVQQKIRITAPNSSEFAGANEHRRGKPPPDRHEIYHVNMPAGNTHRTRQIMQKAKQMREQGLAIRGTTGVRQAGRSVSPIDKSSLAARIQRKQIAEVSSSTDRRQQGSKIARIAASGIKKTISNRPSLSSRLTHTNPSGSLQIRMAAPKTSRIEGRLQKVVTTTTSSSRSSGIYVGDDDDDFNAGDGAVEYQMEEDMVDYEEEDVDEMPYEEELVEEEYDDDVLTVPVRQRISFAPSTSSSGPARLASTVQRAPSNPRHHHQNRNRNNINRRLSSPPPQDPPTVFSRLSFHSSRR